MFTLNCRGKIISIEKPLVMGIINATPDSFYKGHLNEGNTAILQMAEQMIADGADILDIGGQSTRPGSDRLNAADEWERVFPVIEIIREKFPAVILSIDTYHSNVAEKAIKAGVDIVNDISGGDMDPGMIDTVAALHTPYVCMHMKGTPETMQQNASYEDVTKELLDHFIQKTTQCRDAGINDLIIDPGFGFGKTIEHNFRLLHDLPVFEMLNCPILVGLSRKATVYKTLGVTAAEALNGTTVLNTIALEKGAHILRVHDIKEAREAISLFTAYKKIAP